MGRDGPLAGLEQRVPFRREEGTGVARGRRSRPFLAALGPLKDTGDHRVPMFCNFRFVIQKLQSNAFPA